MRIKFHCTSTVFNYEFENCMLYVFHNTVRVTAQRNFPDRIWVKQVYCIKYTVKTCFCTSIVHESVYATFSFHCAIIMACLLYMCTCMLPGQYLLLRHVTVCVLHVSISVVNCFSKRFVEKIILTFTYPPFRTRKNNINAHILLFTIYQSRHV